MNVTRSLTPARFHEILSARRTAIKPSLLNQRILAGVGNIYAAEALWLARIDPFTVARDLSHDQYYFRNPRRITSEPPPAPGAAASSARPR